MAEVTNELMYGVLKQIQSDIRALRDGQLEHAAALTSIRVHMVATQQDIANLYAASGRQQAQLERIERRLGLVEVP